ncbi:hypothetical protein [Streptosporangium sp. NPDC048865]|uniref:hypothetical protein n=1 Tax=Streptosporangium sp. NPDC048865 TaxID=3155766 RepID=UPI003421D449
MTLRGVTRGGKATTGDGTQPRNGRSTIRDRMIAVPMLVMVVTFGVVGYRLYDRASEDPPLPPDKVGRVLFFASEGAEISEATLRLSPPDAGQRASRLLSIELKARPAESGEGKWALFVDHTLAPKDGAGRLRIPELTVGCAVPKREGVANVCDKYEGDPISADIGPGTARAGGGPFPDYGAGLVVSGDIPDVGPAESGRGVILLRVPVERGSVQNTDAQYLIRPPVLGNDLLPYGDQIVLNYREASSRTTSSAKAPTRTEWHITEGAPGEGPEFRVVVTQKLGERLTDVTFNPRSPSDWTWTGLQILDVEALAVRPHVQIRQQRDLFWAAVWISLSSAFLVWFLEIVTTAVRAAPGTEGDADGRATTVDAPEEAPPSSGDRVLRSARRTLARHIALRADRMVSIPLDQVSDADFGLIRTWRRLDPAAARTWLRAQIDERRWPLSTVITRLVAGGGPPGRSPADEESADVAGEFLGARYLLTRIRDELADRPAADR